MATATAVAEEHASRPHRPAHVALLRRVLRDSRTRTIAFVYLFAIVSYVQPVAYRHTYPTIADRIAFAHSFANNKAVVLFYGKAYDLLTVGGYSAWRVGGTLAILASVFGLLAAIRALRTEEETGRAELTLAGIVSRRAAFLTSMVAIAIGTALLWVAIAVGSIAGGLPAGGSAYLALAVVSVVPVFVGVGAVASQLAATRRLALELGVAVVAIAFVLRVIADTSSSLSWLRWATPLGWAEELRPFTGAQPLVLLLPLVVSAALLCAAEFISRGRDVGTGVFSARETAAPDLRLLSSPTAQALRGERTSLALWCTAIGAFALIVGVISKSISSAGISKQLERELAKLGSGSVLTPKGYMGFSFIFFLLATALLACSQIAAARHEESEQRLETLLALPVGRSGWLGGRLVLAGIAILTVSVLAGLCAWLGAVSQGVGVSLGQMLLAGLNCVPIAILFLGISAVAFALLPRATAGVAYGLVTIAFLWQLFGALLGLPHWLAKITPFAHVRAVPAQSFGVGAALAMLAGGAVASLVAIALFERRDLTGA